MSVLSVLALAGSVGLATAHPFSLWSRAEVPAFPAGSSWDILLAGGEFSGVEGIGGDGFQVIDIDLFDTTKETIAELKATKLVICYFSAGSKEDWRDDATDFDDADTGNPVGGGPDGDVWPGELWVDVTSDNVKNIMKARIEKAAESGCDAVDPDNVDGFDNETGFDHPKSSYVEYVKFMAQVAKDNGLAIGLKNAVDMIPDVVDFVDFAVNEQCHEYRGECAKYKPFTDQNKAVFNIEYGGNACESPEGVKLSTLIKSEDQGLNELGGACPGQDVETPTVEQPSTPASTTAPTSTKVAQPTATGTTPVEVGENDDEGGNAEDDQGNENEDGTEGGQGEEEEEQNDEEDNNPPRGPYRWRGGRWRGGRWNW